MRLLSDYSYDLKSYRKRLGVRQEELALRLGFAGAPAIWRREVPVEHKDHVAMTAREYAAAITAIEEIVEERGGRPDPAKALEATR